MAFWHPKPFRENHILIIPKRQIKNLTSLKDDDREYVFEVFKVAGEIVKELGWEKEGYSLLVNGGKRQEVNQLHCQTLFLAGLHYLDIRFYSDPRQKIVDITPGSRSHHAQY